MRRFIVILLGAGLLAAAMVPPVFASATTETENFKGIVETFTDELPCVGEAVITIEYNGVLHFTENKNGFHITGTFAGKFVADPVEAGVPTYNGRFSQWFGGNSTSKSFNETFTFSVTGKADDGSKITFHEVAHITSNANGDITAEFDKASCA